MLGGSRNRSSRGRGRRSGVSHPPRRRSPASGHGRPAASGVDVHLHLSRFWPDPDVNQYGPEIDFTLRGLLSEMDRHGLAFGLLLQVNESPSVTRNLEEGRTLFRESGGRLLQSSTLDPTQGPEAIASAIRQWRDEPTLSAIKLYPGYQHFYPHHRSLEPVYRFAAEAAIPVFVHQGDTLDPRGLVKFSRPIEMDEVAVAHREVNFVLCHFGNPWVEEAAELVYKNENVWVDTSGLLWAPTLPRFEQLVRRAQERVGNAISEIGDTSRVLYGSDWPLESLARAVGFIEGLALSSAEKRAVMGENAQRLLRVGRSTGSRS